ncbi:hypothetical protein FACS1894172_08520 [Spirochaetia bacterium]|nr:hypothetical protein FACS1894164_18840 [Spirochaetia bacterium]GHU32243.1 hypothetical protein FACS1894172_08520 [Spirochaetia bacterium]
MIDKGLIDNLNLNARVLATRWKDKIRQAAQLKRYNESDDETLINTVISLFPLTARTLDRGMDRSLMGGAFVSIGKESVRSGFPVSEVIYGINLVEQTVIEYIMTDFVNDNPLKMYSAMSVVTTVAEFFILGCFYLTKGFLEETYTHLNKNEAMSEEILKKYFKDDFFFKKS